MNHPHPHPDSDSDSDSSGGADRFVLVVNAGSSSLKYSLIEATTGAAAAAGLVERIGEPTGRIVHRTTPPGGPAGVEGKHVEEVAVADHEAAMRVALAALESHGPGLTGRFAPVAVGHRVVHGGERFSAPTLVTPDLVTAVEQLVPLAPLHNPANLEGIKVAGRLFPTLPQVAVFDTAFHQTLPPHAYTYAVPRAWARDHGIRRYGFHGTSVQYVTRTAATHLHRPVTELKLIVLHLGNGASATAVDAGNSVETSMGFTPLEGLVMGTRSGDVDPALTAHLTRTLHTTAETIDAHLNRDSGIKGLLGYNDFRELDTAYEAGDPDATLALAVYTHRIRKYIGAYTAILGGLDALIFTGGIGENDHHVRAHTLTGLTHLGLHLDPHANTTRPRTPHPHTISTPTSPTTILIVPTNEEAEIAHQTLQVATSGD